MLSLICRFFPLTKGREREGGRQVSGAISPAQSPTQEERKTPVSLLRICCWHKRALIVNRRSSEGGRRRQEGSVDPVIHAPFPSLSLFPSLSTRYDVTSHGDSLLAVAPSQAHLSSASVSGWVRVCRRSRPDSLMRKSLVFRGKKTATTRRKV